MDVEPMWRQHVMWAMDHQQVLEYKPEQAAGPAAKLPPSSTCLHGQTGIL
jgi:hypothetical protein